jgi:dolichol-phosphate mannosyltransferase
MNTHTVVILPTFNEVKNIGPIIDKIHSVVPYVRILVVDDNSPDGTADIISARSTIDDRVSLLLRQKKEGLGRAYVHAFMHTLQDSRVEQIIMMDADFSHDPEYLIPMIEARESADLVIGSRYIRGGSTEGWEPWRKALSNYGNLYCHVVTGMNIHDATGGFNCISASALRSINFDSLDLSGYAFQMQLKYAFWKKGFKITEIPIVFKNRREGESKISNHIILEGILAPWKLRLK